MALERHQHIVSADDTAISVGSGDLPVLATPRLIGWLERAAYQAAKSAIDDDQTTVGTLVRMEHLKGSPVGTTLSITCSKAVSDGRRLIFHVTAEDEHGDECASGEIHRRVVDPERFMARFTRTES